MGKTHIQWSEATWNPIRGCSLVSPGCTNCYAMREANRKRGSSYKGLTRIGPNGPVWTGDVRFVPEMLDYPLRLRKPHRIFVNSMSDLFHEKVTDAEIDQVFAIMMMAPHHTFQILTKRPERMQRWFRTSATLWESKRGHKVRGERRDDVLSAALHLLGPSGSGRFNEKEILDRQDEWPLKNVWIGVSCEDQDTADERIPLLMETPAIVRWVSAEPLLGMIDLEAIPTIKGSTDWIVVGGESGPHARPMHLEWARGIVEQCQAANVPVFVKQLGARPSHYVENAGTIPVLLKNRKGGEMNEWPEDLRIREYPEVLCS